MSGYPESTASTLDESAGAKPIEQVAPEKPEPKLFVDISDLFAYFQFNRMPTGVQRVQTEIARHLVSAYSDADVSLTRLSEATGEWKQVPALAFEELIVASEINADVDNSQWMLVRDRVSHNTLSGANTVFPPNAVLVNIGSSWWSPNYFLHIRELKRRFGTGYVPFIHDMIPIVDQESCGVDLTTRFIDWLTGVLHHADYFLANSEASKADLIAVAGQLGATIASDQAGVVHLDGDYRRPPAPGAITPAFPGRIVGPFVLLVSTIEQRKNQIMALDAWRELINRHGADNVPQLVMVGKVGNQGDQVVQRLTLDPDLARRVVMLSGIDDAQLAMLYQRALFTFYPSRYEGWGLPVTESLCFGKTALVARNSSLPEAGGEYAVYFESNSLRSLLTKLESLVFDAATLTACNERARAFQPRSWGEISEQLRGFILGWHRTGTVDRARLTSTIVRGGYYPLRQNASTIIWPGMGDNERLRSGNGWYRLEEWGCWASAAGGQVSFNVADAAPMRIALRVNIPGYLTREVTISDAGNNLLAATVVEPNASKWIAVRVTPIEGRVEVTLRASESLREDSGRLMSVGLSGMFIFTDADAGDYELVEAVALGSLIDHDPHRRPFPTPLATY